LSVIITGAVGLLVWLITIGLLAKLLPQALLHVAVYVAATFTVIVFVVAPVLHVKLPTQPFAVNNALSPTQILVLSVIITGGFGLLVWLITIGLLAKLLPQALLHVAVYVPAAFTVIVFVVAPVLHVKLPTQPLTLNFVLSPTQIPVLPVIIKGALGLLPVLITISFDLGLTPQIVSHTTVYVPATLTVIRLVVAPVLQFKIPLQPLALNIALSPTHNTSLFVNMSGVLGFTPVLITIGVDEELLPHSLLHVAV
jgi:hypothetical protein